MAAVGARNTANEVRAMSEIRVISGSCRLLLLIPDKAGLLKTDDVGRSKPAIFAGPFQGREQVPVFLGGHKPAEEGMLLVVTLDQVQKAVVVHAGEIILRHNKRD